MEQTSGDMNRHWQGGAPQAVQDDGVKDGRVFVYLTADWAQTIPPPPTFKIRKRNKVPIKVVVLGPDHHLLQCTAVVVLRGSQCGPVHLQIVGHIRDWLWANSTPKQTRRLVEGSGPVDYINIIWCAPSSMALYREATRAHGLCEYEWGADGEVWDAFWYIYKRNLKTPSYAHIGLDTSASLVQQGHVTGEVKACLRGAWESSMQEHDQAGGKKPKGGKKGECAVQ